jgi:glycosyltransferase involved in cell wall biosynthesis
VQKLSQAILKLIENPGLRRKMGKAGRRYVLANYDIEENALLFKNLYHKLVGEVE